MLNYPGWIEGTPNTNENAKVNKYRTANNVRAIQVNKASYRRAIIDGIFELDNQNYNDDPVYQLPSGKNKVKVICTWFGCTPNTSYPNLDLSNAASYKIINNYSGEVVENIGN